MTWKKGETGNPSGGPSGPQVGRAPALPWRDFLTREERSTLQMCEEVKAQWKSLGAMRTAITNRAIHRAKAGPSAPPNPQ